MIDHSSIAVHNFEKSKQFYDETFKHLGYERLMTFKTDTHNIAGYGVHKKPSFWISAPLASFKTTETIGKAAGVHVAFLAPNVDAVNKWHETCLQYGGKDNGKPGPRPQYHPGYYGAFIVDPNGWRIEACFHQYQG